MDSNGYIKIVWYGVYLANILHMWIITFIFSVRAPSPPLVNTDPDERILPILNLRALY